MAGQSVGRPADPGKIIFALERAEPLTEIFPMQLGQPSGAPVSVQVSSNSSLGLSKAPLTLRRW